VPGMAPLMTFWYISLSDICRATRATGVMQVPERHACGRCVTDGVTHTAREAAASRRQHDRSSSTHMPRPSSARRPPPPPPPPQPSPPQST
jgi:hypothetical protein